MCVAAHPDDEDGATLTVLRRKLGVHTVTLFSTYGEGGQNATGPELYEELGVIRARETEEASKIQGSEAYFLGLTDFGFSKSAEEAFRIWGHEEALRRMVLKIRELRPDVIITNHDTISGHGHHQATGRLVLEAFDAAADPARFPEQLRDGRVQTWQAQRLFVRAANEGGTASKATDDEAARSGRLITIDRNERDPVRGSTYAEQALQALQRHASQGPWPQTIPPQGWPPVRYRLARAAKQAAEFPANAQTFLDNLSIPGEPASKVVPLAVKGAFSLYESRNASHESVLGALISLRKNNVFVAPADSVDKARFQLMNRRLDRALAVASGVSAELVPAGIPLLIPGTQPSYSVYLHNRGEKVIEIKRSAFRIDGLTVGGTKSTSLLQSNQSFRSVRTFSVPPTAFINVPLSSHLYDGHLSGEELSEEFLLEVEGASFTVTATERINVSPPVEIESVSPSPLVVTPQTARAAQTFTFRVNNHTPKFFEGWLLSSDKVGSVAGLRLPSRVAQDVTIKYKLPAAAMSVIRRRAEWSTTERFFIKSANIAEPPKPVTEQLIKIAYADARVSPELRVGFIRSSDFTLPNALASLGVQSKELTIDEIRAGTLQNYDAIVIDNRGYQAHAELISLNQRLLDYAQQGGTLVVFYHKTNEWNPDARANRPQLAPYEVLLGNSRVTDENAPVTFTDPQHPLLNFPNKISARDFEGWVQERGLYFPKAWDKRYSAPLAMSDAGEPALQGGLLATEYGRGRYIYTSIVWYRQLRDGLPGAYRMLANMISYGHEDRKRSR
jgi:LmbE family N-acetylglucosaminyl deacetylase